LPSYGALLIDRTLSGGGACLIDRTLSGRGRCLVRIRGLLGLNFTGNKRRQQDPKRD
jgi:hypothetical protein